MRGSITFTNQLTFFQKLRSFDYTLLTCIMLIGLIGIFSMYSTDGGEILYHTKNHTLRFCIFFTMMIIISFINIRVWHNLSYLFYLVTLLLLVFDFIPILYFSFCMHFFFSNCSFCQCIDH